MSKDFAFLILATSFFILSKYLSGGVTLLCSKLFIFCIWYFLCLISIFLVTILSSGVFTVNSPYFGCLRPKPKRNSPFSSIGTALLLYKTVLSEFVSPNNKPPWMKSPFRSAALVKPANL